MAVLVDARAIALDYMERQDWRTPEREMRLRLNEDFCRTVADWYERAPSYSGRPAEHREYRRFKDETRRQFDALHAAGVRIEPWLNPGQPYKNSADLYEKLHTTGMLYVYLTANGHGQKRSGTRAPGSVAHPMLEPSPVVVSGVRFSYNDLFRAVHDVFGHAANGNNFSLEGEHRATWDHMQMYSPLCHRALLTETVCQICWFYCGKHLRRADGSLPRISDPDYVRPADRPYSLQHTNLMPNEFVASYYSLFTES